VGIAKKNKESRKVVRKWEVRRGRGEEKKEAKGCLTNSHTESREEEKFTFLWYGRHVWKGDILCLLSLCNSVISMLSRGRYLSLSVLAAQGAGKP
jgi:hypothetical protein